MRALKLALFLSVGGICGCGSGGGGAAGPTLAVYKYLGTLQCTGGGVSLPTLERQLTDAGIRVLAATCGTDGRVYAAVCGAPDGRIGIFEVDGAQGQLASSLGFDPLSSLPAARRAPCG